MNHHYNKRENNNDWKDELQIAEGLTTGQAEETHPGFEPWFVINHERTEAVIRGRGVALDLSVSVCSLTV